MFAFRRTLRFRLMVTFVAVFGAVFALFAFVGVLALQQYLYQSFDDQAVGRVRQMVGALVQSENPGSTDMLREVFNEEVQTIYYNNFYVQLRELDGTTIQRSDNLRGRNLPFQPLPDDVDADQEILQTVEVPGLSRNNQNMNLRLATRRVQSPGIKPIYVQVATNLEFVESGTMFVKRAYWIGLPTALLAAAIASWFASGRAMRQIAEISRVVRALTPRELDKRRIESPHTDDELSALVDDLNQMLARLETGFRTQEQFIHDASHELKTPLSIMLSQAQVEQMSNTTSDGRSFAKSVAYEARHLSQLVESLLALARAETTQDMANAQLCAVNDVTVNALQQGNMLAEEKNVSLNLQLEMDDDSEPMMFFGDPDLVTAMISNLIRNAVAFSPANERVQVSVHRAAQHAVIAVRDHGPGVPNEAIEHIFDRFVQAGPAPSKRGTGLGLAIAKSVAQLHGGELNVANLEDGGCRFTVTIRLQ